MMKTRRHILKIICFLTGTIMLAGCIVYVKTKRIQTQVQSKYVTAPVKVHLKDGRTALFRGGADFTTTEIIGNGQLYTLDLKDQSEISSLDRDSVAAYEVFSSDTDPASTVMLSTIATAGAAAGIVFSVAALSVAIFGSCPTIYANVSDTTWLQAELFSNSIAPILETRDHVLLNAFPDEHGLLRLEVRNEALETHYINHLELVEVVHNPGQRVVPTNGRDILILGPQIQPIKATDGMGRNLGTIFRAKDGVAFQSDIRESIDASEVQWDQIDLVFPPSDSSSVALQFNLRRSLFTTILLYDYLLSGRGPQTLNWLGSKLNTVSEAMALGLFDNEYMPLKIEQEIDGVYHEVGKISKAGPIGWRDIALPLTVNPGDSIKVRLRFLADSWRIDKVTLAAVEGVPVPRIIAPSAITGVPKPIAGKNLSLLLQADANYAVTSPGDRFFIEFNTSEKPEGMEASYLLAGQGYYFEWIRESWLNREQVSDSPVYAPELVCRAQQRWQHVKASFEQQFYNTKIPVR